MTLQASGAISLANVQSEFGGSAPVGITEYYGAAAGVPTSGTISLENFWGKSSTAAGATNTLTMGGWLTEGTGTTGWYSVAYPWGTMGSALTYPWVVNGQTVWMVGEQLEAGIPPNEPPYSFLTVAMAGNTSAYNVGLSIGGVSFPYRISGGGPSYIASGNLTMYYYDCPYYQYLAVGSVYQVTVNPVLI